MSDKLSNCPFCGYHAQVTEGSGAFFGRVQVECSSCRIATFWLDEDVARQLWNRRTSHAPAIPAVDAAAVIEQCAIRAAIHSQYPVETNFDRGYDKARKDAARSIRALKAAPAISESEWQPICTAPKDGTAVDLWVGGEFASRWPDCYWGLPDHCCGEQGEYCDDDWHDLEPGWVDTMNQPLPEDRPTHWRLAPGAPDDAARKGGKS